MKVFSPISSTLTGLLLALAVSSSFADDVVQYSPVTDRISINASNVSLTRLLSRIATETGIAISIEPSIEKNISLKVNNQPTEKALQKMGKELSYVLEYGSAVRGGVTLNNTVVAMKLLPKGMQDSDQLVNVNQTDMGTSSGQQEAGGQDYFKVDPSREVNGDFGNPVLEQNIPQNQSKTSPGEDSPEAQAGNN